MRLHTYSALTLLLITSACKKDEQSTQPVAPTTPQVRIVSPLNNSSLGAGLVPVLVEATDDKGVAKVQVYVDSQLDTTLSVPPYRYLWDTGSYSDSSRHAIFAKAYDTDNNVTGSEVVMTTVFTLRPSNLQVTTATDTSVTLQWSDNSRVETGYELEQRENYGSWTRVKQVPFANTTTTTIADTFYVGTTYRFRVRAVQDSTVGGYSNEASVTLQLAPSNLEMTFIADTAVMATWQDNSMFETGFEIEWGLGGGNIRFVRANLPANTTTATVVDTFFVGASYSFGIRARSRYNLSSYVTTQRSFTFPAPSNLNVGFTTDTAATVTWQDNSTFETGFEIEEGIGGTNFRLVKTVGANTTTATVVDTFYAGISYSFRIRARSRYNLSSYATTQRSFAFPSPSNLSMLPVSRTEVRLNWVDNSSFENRFVLERAENNGQYVTIANLPPNAVSYNNTSLDTSKKYSYRVKAESRYNTSAYSNTISIGHFPLYGNIRTLTGHTSDVRSVASSPDGNTIASGSGDNSIKLWRVTDGALLRTLTGHTNIVTSVAFSPDGNTVGSGSSDFSIKLWRVSDGTLLRTWIGNSYNVVLSVAFSPDGNTIASGCGGNDNSINLWRVSDGSLLRTLTGHNSSVNSVAFSPDGNTIASGSSDNSIKLWRVSDGTLLRTLTGHTSDVLSVAFSPDGNTIASGSYDASIKLWRVSDGTLLRTLTGHTYVVYSVVFTGNMIASGSGDASIKLWRVSDGTLLRTLTGHTSGVYSVACSANGNTIASGSLDRAVGLWQSTGSVWQIVP